MIKILEKIHIVLAHVELRIPFGKRKLMWWPLKIRYRKEK